MNSKSEKPIPPRLRAILVDDEPPARTHLGTRLKAHPEIEIVGEADDVTSAFALVESEKPDVIFLDIQMPRHSGFMLLPMLEKVDPLPAIVFVTAFDEYAIRAFEANTLDYLTKPVNPERLVKTISRLKRWPRSGQVSDPSLLSNESLDETMLGNGSSPIKRLDPEDFVLLRDGTLSMMVKAKEINAIESQADYTRILLDHDKGVIMKLTLSHWVNRLPEELFHKVSRSLIVNRRSVERLLQKDKAAWELHLKKTTAPIILSNLESKRLRETLMTGS